MLPVKCDGVIYYLDTDKLCTIRDDMSIAKESMMFVIFGRNGYYGRNLSLVLPYGSTFVFSKPEQVTPSTYASPFALYYIDSDHKFSLLLFDTYFDYEKLYTRYAKHHSFDYFVDNVLTRKTELDNVTSGWIRCAIEELSNLHGDNGIYTNTKEMYHEVIVGQLIKENAIYGTNNVRA